MLGSESHGNPPIPKSSPSSRIAIVGSGFAGSILARALRLRGHSVTLLDRRRHPRFALGESSTPLAALSLERLARLPGLEDLRDLAAHGRWRRNLPELRCGLKRGFTFYRHHPGQPYSNSPGNDSRLLVAASPDDEIADVHWLRADVDEFLMRRAEAAGVVCMEEAEVTELEHLEPGWRLRGHWRGAPFTLDADLLFDASGPGGFLARHLDIERREVDEPRTALVYGHFRDARTLAEAAPGASFTPCPYPDEQAAIHHLIDEGWMYALPFDDGVVSAGVVLAGEHADRVRGADAEALWREILGRYPSLAAMFEGATAVRPVQSIPRIQHWLTRAAGPDWALLPHAFCFFSPMFSTGIAWSLVAVERLLQVVEGAASCDDLASGLARYDRLLRTESEHLQRLVSGAYRAALWDFDLFAAWTDLYFAAASCSELRQRLCSEGGLAWAWWGFLGSTDGRMAPVLEHSLAELRAWQGSDPLARPPIKDEEKRDFIERIRRRIEPFNVAGLADPARNRAYPVDLAPLLRDPHRIGLTSRELEGRLHRLRGDD